MHVFTCFYVTKSVTQIICSQMIMAVTLLSDVGHQNPEPEHGEIQLLTLLPAGQSLSALPRKCWGQTNPCCHWIHQYKWSYEKRTQNRWGGLGKLWGPYKWTVFLRPPCKTNSHRTCCSFQGSENARKRDELLKLATHQPTACGEVLHPGFLD